MRSASSSFAAAAAECRALPSLVEDALRNDPCSLHDHTAPSTRTPLRLILSQDSVLFNHLSAQPHAQQQRDVAIIATRGSTDEGCAATAAALLYRHLHTPGHLLPTSTTTRSSSPTPLPRSKREHEWDASHGHRAVAERSTPPAQHKATYDNLDKLYRQTRQGPPTATHATNHQRHSRSGHGRSAMVLTSHAAMRRDHGSRTR